jgi:hypothetical protein
MHSPFSLGWGIIKAMQARLSFASLSAPFVKVLKP